MGVGGRRWRICVCGGGGSVEWGRERHDGGGGKEMECMYMCLWGCGGGGGKGVRQGGEDMRGGDVWVPPPPTPYPPLCPTRTVCQA